MVIGVCKKNIRPASLTPLCVVPWSACLVRLTVQWQFEEAVDLWTTR